MSVNATDMTYPKSAPVIVKKTKFIKGQEGCGLLSSSEIKAPLSKIPLVGPFLF